MHSRMSFTSCHASCLVCDVLPSQSTVTLTRQATLLLILFLGCADMSLSSNHWCLFSATSISAVSMACCQCTGFRSPGSSGPDRFPATGDGGPPPPAPAPPLPRTEQAPTLGPAPPPPQAAAPPLARHPCQQQAAPAGHTRAALPGGPPWSQITHAPQSSIRYGLHCTLRLLKVRPLHSTHPSLFRTHAPQSSLKVCTAQHSQSARLAASAQHAPSLLKTHAPQSSIRYARHISLRLLNLRPL